MRVLKGQYCQVSYLYAKLNCNQDELSTKTTELEPFLTQSSTDDHEMLDATTVDAEIDQVFDQRQKTQQAASHTLRAARITIAASSQTINPVPDMQIEPTRITPKLQ